MKNVDSSHSLRVTVSVIFIIINVVPFTDKLVINTNTKSIQEE